MESLLGDLVASGTTPLHANNIVLAPHSARIPRRQFPELTLDVQVWHGTRGSGISSVCCLEKETNENYKIGYCLHLQN